MYSCGSGCNKALFYILKPCFIYWIQWLALPLTFHTIEREVVNTNPDHLMALFTSTQFMSQHINLLHVHCPKRGCAKLLIPLWKQRRVSSLLVPQHFNLLVFTANSVVWHWHWKQLKHGSHGFVRTWLLCQEAAHEPGICAAQEWRSSSQGWEIPLGSPEHFFILTDQRWAPTIQQAPSPQVGWFCWVMLPRMTLGTATGAHCPVRLAVAGWLCWEAHKAVKGFRFLMSQE